MVDGEWLDDIINGRFMEKTVQGHVKYILDNSHKRPNHKNGMGLSMGRIKIYETFKNTLNRYRKNVPIASVGLKFSEGFKDWLFKQGYSVNYVGKNIEILKTVCRDADAMGLDVHKELRSIKKISEAKENILILTDQELKAIEETKMPFDYLENAKRWLLLGCLVGQRGGDLMNIGQENMSKIKGVDIFEIVQEKTGKKVVIPIVPDAKKIIDKGFPRKVSLQRLNEYIKEVCRLSGIDTPTFGKKRAKKGTPSKSGDFPKWELVSSHVCRRTFASRFYGKIPTPLLMSVTAHSSEKIFLTYIGKTGYDNALEFMNHF